jgi:hypothetical protein
MGGVAYVDSSALLKVIIREAETPALEADFADRDGLITSRLALLECRRAARRVLRGRALQSLEQVLDSIYVLEVTPAILERAGAADPPALRSLDAIHLATALSIDDSELEVVTYDRRFAEAAAASGLRVVQPGRPAIESAV